MNFATDAEQFTQELLAARTDEHPGPDRDDPLEPAKGLPVLVAALAEPDARVEDDPVG